MIKRFQANLKPMFYHFSVNQDWRSDCLVCDTGLLALNWRPSDRLGLQDLSPTNRPTYRNWYHNDETMKLRVSM